MKKHDFYFDLPSELIAQYPLKNRSDSRLLYYDRANKNEYGHHQFARIVDLLNSGDLLVMNDTKVIPARLYGTKHSGGKVELLVERITDNNSFLAHIKASKALKAGGIIHLDPNGSPHAERGNASPNTQNNGQAGMAIQDYQLEIVERRDDLFLCRTSLAVLELLHHIGHMPLPPYIARDDEISDKERYQTVYAKYEGSVAAPTAGLHFDDSVLAALRAKGINIAYVTLHVGAGTFRPVRCDDIKDHKMHSEYYTVNADLCDLIATTKDRGKRVIAVGTTTLRSLESAAADGGLKPASRETDIFIYPGYEFKVCDGLMTNFHLPESTLLMLVSAFIGHQEAMALYEEAIANKYRFFSYGDTSLLV